MTEKQETQILIRCLQRLNPTWKQADWVDALKISQSSISLAKNGKQPFSGTVRELARKLIADRIADLTGDEYTYRQVQRIAKYYETITGGAETPAAAEMNAASLPLEYKIALAISQRGVAIVL